MVNRPKNLKSREKPDPLRGKAKSKISIPNFWELPWILDEFLCSKTHGNVSAETVIEFLTQSASMSNSVELDFANLDPMTP